MCAKNIWNLFLPVIFFVVISGCAISNQGAVDYRYNRPGTTGGELQPKYISISNAKNRIVAGDPIAVSIKQVFVKDFSEFRSLLRIARREPTSGDIAIVASTCEDPCARKFGSDGVRNSKVIYYSNDVRRGQFLNFSNLHGVYGPISYSGHPFKMDVYIIELDADGTQLSNLAGNLATLGETFYPPAHPVTSILSSLAEVFIQDDLDDTAMAFSFDLKSLAESADAANPDTAFLEAGNYIIVRSEDRSKQIPWSELSFNTSVGRVVYKSCAGELEPIESCYYLDNSYVVVEITKAASAMANDSQQMLFSTLRNTISGAGGAMNSQVSSESVAKIKESLESLEVRSAASGYLSGIKNSAANSFERKTLVFEFVTLWFDGSRSVLASDVNLVAGQVRAFLGQCSGITVEERVGYHDAVKSRNTTNKPELIRALENCSA
ncbi:conserved hypothetical protein [Pseudomonas sp. 8BK]|nr:conserved hypothetical protein [Pseudomonas sp. 8BK]